MQKIDLKSIIRNVPDFPKKGIVFRDITTLLHDPKAFRYVIDTFTSHYENKKIDVILGIESRGFIFSAPLAYKLGTSFAIIRKKGKLPWKVACEEYDLEYGKDKIEIHCDAVKQGQKILLVDDLLATGGTILAAAKLVEKFGGIVEGMAFVVELSYLKGREKLKAHKDYDILSLVNYESE